MPAPPSGLPGTPPPPVDPPRRPVRLLIVIGVLFGVGLVLVVFLLVRDDGDDLDEAASQSDPPPTTETPATEAPEEPASDLPANVQAVVDESMAFVEEQRGLEFREPVDIALLDEEAFTARIRADLAESFEEDAEEIPADEAFLVAFGLAPEDVDLRAQAEQYLTGAVLAFYDTEDDELVMRGTEPTPFFRGTLVHELTHALDDQHFELFREELEDAEDERRFAFDALIEGNAIRVQTAFEGALSADEYNQMLEEQLSFGGDLDFDQIVEVLIRANEWLYIGSRPLLDALVAEGGEAAVDAALEEPPTTSEQVIEPDLFVDDEPVLEVAAPEADGEVTDEGVFGQWFLYYLLDGFDPLFETTLDIGWGADRYVQWDEGERTCVRGNILGDTPEDTAEWADRLGEWAADQPDARVESQGDLAVLTVCG